MRHQAAWGLEGAWVGSTMTSKSRIAAVAVIGLHSQVKVEGSPASSDYTMRNSRECLETKLRATWYH